MAENFVQIGRLATLRLLAERETLYVITDIQDDRMVVVQSACGERKLISIGSLHLLDDVLEIDNKMSRTDVSRKIGVQKRSEEPENDFVRFKRELRKEVEEQLLKSKGF